jgi:hypothetical protein
MSASISYTPPSLQVIRENVCYRIKGNLDILRGFHVITYMGDEEIFRKLENLDGAEVNDFELTACPVVIQQEINDKKVVVLRNRLDKKPVYAVNKLELNGGISTKYFNIDGSDYTGDVNDLELATDNLNYGSAIVYCHDGKNIVTRTDCFDESGQLITIIWQDILGRIISEPKGTLKPGSCDVSLDTEIIPQIDNFLDNEQASGRFATFYRVNVHDQEGSIVFSKTKLADGKDYFPKGLVTKEPIIPPIKAFLTRLSEDQEWKSSRLTQSVSMALEYANKLNPVEVFTGDQDKPVLLTKLNYKMSWGLDGSKDPFLYGIKIKANKKASCLVNWTEQPEIVEMFLSPTESHDPMDDLIDVPPILVND